MRRFLSLGTILGRRTRVEATSGQESKENGQNGGLEEESWQREH